MCYCYQKLEIWKFWESIGSWSISWASHWLRQITWEGIRSQEQIKRRSGADPLPCDLSKPMRGSEYRADLLLIGRGSGADLLFTLSLCNSKCDKCIAQMCHKSLTSCFFITKIIPRLLDFCANDTVTLCKWGVLSYSKICNHLKRWLLLISR